ncbi:hypothetical protein KFE25_005733 [Diacronema lutheri]|uniref:Uncharacterized protein n=1 Tax=Diacronema lutheri TaxID=2081491 RepID=A0A8J5X9R4_DIALT|nr:hypothetical protein KFE25_005733 [Diacronema lutheri]
MASFTAHPTDASTDAVDAPASAMRGGATEQQDESVVAAMLLSSSRAGTLLPTATPARADFSALAFARHGRRSAGTSPAGALAPAADAGSARVGGGAPILDIGSLINAAVAIRTPPNPFGSGAALAAVAAYAGKANGAPPADADAQYGAAGGFPAKADGEVRLNGGGGVGARRAAAGAGVAAAGGLRPRRQLLSRDDVDAHDGARISAHAGGRRHHRRAKERGDKGDHAAACGAHASAERASVRMPDGIAEQRGVLRPWAADNANGCVRVIKRKAGHTLVSRHPGVPNVLSCALHRPAPLIPNAPASGTPAISRGGAGATLLSETMSSTVRTACWSFALAAPRVPAAALDGARAHGCTAENVAVGPHFGTPPCA